MKNQKSTLILFICLVSYAVHGQKGKISGRVFSSSSNDMIPVGATIKLLDKDSLLIRSILTDSLGNFSFNDLPAGSYLLQADALSYSTTKKSVRISGGKNKLLPDTIFMQPFYQDLQSVAVTAKRPNVVIKEDTTEFQAASFKVNKTATVEDIFKKMPGVEVSKNGSVKAQGENITQIYVDGKPFFGTDLKAVTQNFPADLIDKIQIIDKKTDQSLGSKTDDGIREKIINITLRKNAKKGVFGKDYIGYGTEGRYEAKSNTNFINNDKKMSVIVSANNTGRNDSRNDNGAYNSGNGVTDNKQVKINYADKLGNTFDFSVWAGYEQNKSVVEQVINRKNFFSDSSADYFENNNGSYRNKNLYAGLYFEYKPDSVTLIRFNESMGYGNSSNESFSAFNSTDFNGDKINQGANENNGFSKTPSLNGQMSYNRRFGNSGRNVFVNFYNNINNSQSNIYNCFNNYFYELDTLAYTLLLNQLQNNNNRNTNLGTTINYSEPIAPNNTLDFGYSYSYGNNDMPKEVYDFNYQTNLYDLLNDSLSNHFDNYINSNTASFNYSYNSKKTGFSVGFRWKNSLTQSYSPVKDELYQQTFTGFLPNFNFYFSGKRKRLNIYYNSYVRAPQAYQLQPVTDNTNPLYLRLGNPDLQYASVQSLRYNFNYYNPKKETGFNSNANFSIISNNISTSILFDNTTGKQISQPLNTDGAYNWNIWVSYFKPFYFGDDKVKWNINVLTSGSKMINLLNGKENTNKNNFIRVFFGLTYDTPEWIDFHTDFSMSRQMSEYSLQPDHNNTSYFFSISPNITFKPVSNTEINIDYDYRQTTGQATGFNTSVNMLNANITQYLSSKKDIWIMLKAFDLFNQNMNVWRIYGDNFIQDTRANGLSRFLLLSLNFRLSKFNNIKDNQPLSHS